MMSSEFPRTIFLELGNLIRNIQQGKFEIRVSDG